MNEGDRLHVERDTGLTDLGESQVVRHFARKEIIFHPDSNPQAIFLVQEGQVRLYMTDRQGREFTIHVLRPGDIFPGHTRCYGEALTEGQVAFVHRDAFVDLLHHPGVPARLVRVLGNSLRNAFDIIESLAFRAVSSRLAWLLLSEAEMRGTPTPDGVALQWELTNEQIASRIGSSRQTTSTLLTDLVRQGTLMRQNKRLVIRDREALVRLSAGEPS